MDLLAARPPKWSRTHQEVPLQQDSTGQNKHEKLIKIHQHSPTFIIHQKFINPYPTSSSNRLFFRFALRLVIDMVASVQLSGCGLRIRLQVEADPGSAKKCLQCLGFFWMVGLQYLVIWQFAREKRTKLSGGFHGKFIHICKWNGFPMKNLRFQ